MKNNPTCKNCPEALKKNRENIKYAEKQSDNLTKGERGKRTRPGGANLDKTHKRNLQNKTVKATHEHMMTGKVKKTPTTTRILHQNMHKIYHRNPKLKIINIKLNDDYLV